MISIARALLAFALAMVAFAPSAEAAKRMALVIGIDAYKSLPKLEKAAGDARAMSGALKGLGFDVTQVINASRRELNIQIARFAARLSEDDLAFVHFSGHGVEIDGENFLLAADVPKPANGQKDAVKYEGIGLRRLIGQIAATGVRARVLVLDACRDNPFEQAGARSIGSTRGLARTEVPMGTFIMYSAGYRQAALDKLGPSDNEPTSVFTGVLLDKLSLPGTPISHIAREVRNQVQVLAKNAGHTQRPAYYDELSSGLYLNGRAPQTTAGKPPQRQPSDEQQTVVELTYWNSVKSAPTADALRSYLQAYPTGRFAPLARIRIKELERSKGSQSTQRLASVSQQATSTVTDEDRAIQPVPTGLSERDLTLKVQTQLARVGCNPGPADGAWGKKGRRALKAFARHSKIQLASLNPSQDVLKVLMGRKARVCPLICGRRHVVRANRCVLKKCPRSKILNQAGRCVVKAQPKPKSKKTRRPMPKKQAARSSAKQPGVCKSWGAGDYFPVCGSYYLKLKRKSWCRR